VPGDEVCGERRVVVAEQQVEKRLKGIVVEQHAAITGA
jgi:hypothetical protein